MDEQIKLAFTFASDLSKQLITLSTGILAITIAFTKDIVKRVSAFGAFVLAAAWFFYLLSVICGIWVLMALTGTLAPLEHTISPLSLGENIRRPSAYQIFSFLIATLLIIIYGIISIFRSRSENSDDAWNGFRQKIFFEKTRMSFDDNVNKEKKSESSK